MPRTKKKVKSIVKTKVISARVTEVVHELLHQQAEDAGMALSEFAAQMLMKGRVNTSYVFYVHPDEIEAITREFAAIGNNLNQIAMFFNSGGIQSRAMLGKVTKNNGNRCSAYVPEHHEAIVSPEIARAAHLVASSRKKCGVQDIVVIQQGTLKGFVGIHPNWSGINAESIRSLCLNAYLPEEVVELNDMTEMRSGKKSDMVLLSDYLTVSGTCFINQSSPVITISKNGIRFSKACHTRLDDCEYVELLYHPILQVVILRKSNHDFSTAMHWREDNDVHSAFSARAFSGLVFQTLNWRRNCRYQCRGICRGQGNAKFLIFELDESRILTGKNQYEQAEECSINLKCRLYRSKWLQSITVSDVMESGQVVENPMIGAIPSRNEVQRELDDLLMSM